MKFARLFVVLTVPVLMAGCTSEPAPAKDSTTTTAAPPAAATTTTPRVFFIEPQDGATVKSPVHLKFGIENYQLSPVPQGEVKEARPGMGHHHVGIDQDCLAPGNVIVKGTPSWIHFGDGKSEIDAVLTPGPHKLSLQLGDDLHTTKDGLCQTIHITVAP